MALRRQNNDAKVISAESRPQIKPKRPSNLLCPFEKALSYLRSIQSSWQALSKAQSSSRPAREFYRFGYRHLESLLSSIQDDEILADFVQHSVKLNYWNATEELWIEISAPHSSGIGATLEAHTQGVLRVKEHGSDEAKDFIRHLQILVNTDWYARLGQTPKGKPKVSLIANDLAYRYMSMDDDGIVTDDYPSPQFEFMYSQTVASGLRKAHHIFWNTEGQCTCVILINYPSDKIHKKKGKDKKLPRNGSQKIEAWIIRPDAIYSYGNNRINTDEYHFKDKEYVKICDDDGVLTGETIEWTLRDYGTYGLLKDEIQLTPEDMDMKFSISSEQLSYDFNLFKDQDAQDLQALVTNTRVVRRVEKTPELEARLAAEAEASAAEQPAARKTSRIIARPNYSDSLPNSPDTASIVSPPRKRVKFLNDHLLPQSGDGSVSGSQSSSSSRNPVEEEEDMTAEIPDGLTRIAEWEEASEAGDSDAEEDLEQEEVTDKAVEAGKGKRKERRAPTREGSLDELA